MNADAPQPAPVAPADLANPPLKHEHVQSLKRQMEWQAERRDELLLNVEFRLAEQVVRATEALMSIANGEGAYGAQAVAYKNEARIALGWPVL